jgi:hypothetical protein
MLAATSAPSRESRLSEEPEVGRQIARRADRSEAVLVPVLCLAEAYRRVRTDGANLLDIVQGIDHIVVTPVEQDMASVLGGFTNQLGRMDVAQLVITAAEHSLVPVMTSERKLITRILPDEWPIIDL